MMPAQPAGCGAVVHMTRATIDAAGRSSVAHMTTVDNLHLTRGGKAAAALPGATISRHRWGLMDNNAYLVTCSPLPPTPPRRGGPHSNALALIVTITSTDHQKAKGGAKAAATGLTTRSWTPTRCRSNRPVASPTATAHLQLTFDVSPLKRTHPDRSRGLLRRRTGKSLFTGDVLFWR